MFLNLEGFFYVLFSGGYSSAHTKQNLSIHSISENGRKPVKKISASAAVLLTLKVEVQSPYNRICISHNREGHRAFAVFLLSFFIGIRRRTVTDVRCRSPPALSGKEDLSMGEDRKTTGRRKRIVPKGQR